MGLTPPGCAGRKPLPGRCPEPAHRRTSPWSLSGTSAEANLSLVAVRNQRRGEPLPGRRPEPAQRQTSPSVAVRNQRRGEPLPGRCPEPAAEANLSPVAVRNQRRGKPLPGRCPEPAQRRTSPWSLSEISAEANLTLAPPRTGFEANLTLVQSAGSEPRCATAVPEWDGLCGLPPDVRFSMSRDVARSERRRSAGLARRV